MRAEVGKAMIVKVNCDFFCDLLSCAARVLQDRAGHWQGATGFQGLCCGDGASGGDILEQMKVLMRVGEAAELCCKTI